MHSPFIFDDLPGIVNNPSIVRLWPPVGALVWAVHPLDTEAVVYATQRTELLVALFYLTTLWAALRFWSADSTGTRTFWLVAAALACVAAMASKEVAVSLPLVVLLYE